MSDPPTEPLPHPAWHLLELPDAGALVRWYVDPPAPGEAQRLLGLVRERLQQAIQQRRPSLYLRVLELLARHWLGGAGAGAGLDALAATAGAGTEAALVALLRGQLLMSSKRAGANEALASGFALAANLVTSQDYFLLMHRHDLLSWLVLSAEGSEVEGLAALEAEASVIRRLSGGSARAHAWSRFDTLG